MRLHVRNLSKRNMGDSFGKWIAGSWSGLRTEMTRFFEQSPIHSQFVLEQQLEQLKQAQDRRSSSAGAQVRSEDGQVDPNAAAD
jgi:hypothetical protein